MTATALSCGGGRGVSRSRSLVQVYGGSAFERLRDEGDDAFLSLPAPVHAVDPVLAALMAQ